MIFQPARLVLFARFGHGYTTKALDMNTTIREVREGGELLGNDD